jgi:biopolymer transport protein ExbB
MLRFDLLFGQEPALTVILALATLATVVITLERAFTLYVQYRLKFGAFKKALVQALQDVDLNRALQITALSEQHPACRVARAGLLKANAGDRDVGRAMEAAQFECLPRVQGLTAFLAILGNLGTLLGLIGTVLGMIEAFAGLGVSDSGAKQEILARGIALALNFTASGILVAIVGTFFATLFSHRQERILDQMDETAVLVQAGVSQAARDARARAGARA